MTEPVPYDILFLVMFVTKKEQSCCFTGHRIIAPEHLTAVEARLNRQICRLTDNGIYRFIAGGARGFDSLAAETVLALRETQPQIQLLLALPCKNQTKGWRAADKARYDQILRQADEVRYLAEAYESGCMMRRNRFMVDNSCSCIFYLTHMRSGTCKTVEYAMKQGHELYNILCKDEENER